MTVGIVGLGSAGQRHLKNALALGCDVIAYDINPSQIDAQLGAARVSLGDPLDADMVVIACPADSHIEWVQAAQARGRRILVEKPVASPGTLDAASSVRPKGLTVGYNWLWDDGVRRHMSLAADAQDIYVSVDTNAASWPGRHYTDLLFECSHELAVLDAWMGPLRLQASSMDSHGGVLTGVAENDTRRRWVFAWRTDAHVGSEGRIWHSRSPSRGMQFRMPDLGALDASYRAMMRDFVAGWSECVSGWNRGLRVAHMCARALRHRGVDGG
jgi:predicted dehydrogenase